MNLPYGMYPRYIRLKRLLDIEPIATWGEIGLKLPDNLDKKAPKYRSTAPFGAVSKF